MLFVHFIEVIIHDCVFSFIKIYLHKAFIQDNSEEGVLKTRIAEKLIQRFQLTPQKANEYIEKYH